MSSLEIDLVTYLSEQSQTAKQKDESQLRAHALVQWLLAHHFPSKIRKSSLPVSVSSPRRGHICIKSTTATMGQTTDEKEGTPTTTPTPIREEDSLDGPKSKWEKNVFQALKKVTVDDLGHMNATELQSSIPAKDKEGRGMMDLQALEKKLCVKVVFDCNETDHVLLVGDEKKLEKKVFVIRNMLSHYHWRLSGTDVAMGKNNKAAASR
mmetsp:Transcript_41314/g.86721  ORF Transcript_41314/g.86721 Transcript_41314/m.86721 type:complete len:209 (+) Transcript_41314:196-822(+)|eukprot:CAMPEP_0183707392 /NCGR_PEP_ID=MMETSP0737-20130205/3977_1 /TAXON_ID=385413 /ORGANISM="Thalassiosira miniscula, Strain CCMP1093" /LENGTH=208 /DNA_ID=CAMNT_0025935041 /DNA_START=148 /DNA_END=774 /DNA_ORIENTATION=+